MERNLIRERTKASLSAARAEPPRGQAIEVSAAGVAVRIAAGVELKLQHVDRMLSRLDLGYAMNTHNIQGAAAMAATSASSSASY